MYNLYIGDIDEQEILEWLSENIAHIALTTKEEFAYYSTYHSDDDLWILNTADVSDVSLTNDTITSVMFKNKEDVLLAKLRWGGSIS
jgi:hypothetical protein